MSREEINTWHSYPAEFAIEGRPWWRSTKRGPTRTDGVALVVDDDDVSADELVELKALIKANMAAHAKLKESGYEFYQASLDAEYALDLWIAKWIDRNHPLPAPPPLVGQVWVWPETDSHSPVVGVDRGRAVFVGMEMDDGGVADVEDFGECETYPALMNIIELENWPPKGAVLVAGPQSPWMWTGEPVEES